MKYFVSRQVYWPDGDHVVEIASGGCDYANPDMLVPHYPGEGQEYDDPREALKAAFAIRDAWKDCRIEHGFTGGYTMPFSDEPTDQELTDWAKAEYDSIPKCPICGEPYDPSNAYYLVDYGNDETYCSEYCADKAYSSMFDDIEEGEASWIELDA